MQENLASKVQFIITNITVNIATISIQIQTLGLKNYLYLEIPMLIPGMSWKCGRRDLMVLLFQGSQTVDTQMGVSSLIMLVSPSYNIILRPAHWFASVVLWISFWAVVEPSALVSCHYPFCTFSLGSESSKFPDEVYEFKASFIPNLNL